LAGFFVNKTMPDKFQEQIAAIWARALGVKKVEPDDNFFAVGGHSLLGVKMIAEIQAKTGIEEELKLSDLLEFPTLAAFTAHLESLMAPSEETGSL
jgi:surfactin family lipopeptide synthetase B/lichenysin synthetase B